jgi:hypothetical protein
LAVFVGGGRSALTERQRKNGRDERTDLASPSTRQ